MRDKVTREFGWPWVIVASALAAGAATVVDLGSPIQPVTTFWFLLVCPGIAFVRLLHVDSFLVELTLAVALSLSLDVGVAQAMLFAGLWSPKASLFVLISVALLGAVVQVARIRLDCRKVQPEP